MPSETDQSCEDERRAGTRKSSKSPVGDLLDNDVELDVKTWTKIVLILALTLATLNGVDPGVLLSGV